MSINSRSKGNRAERVAATVITEWTGRKFAKTPSSGGLQWKKSYVKGDITCTVEGHFCPFVFEVKSHREIDFSQILNPGIKDGRIKVWEFWNQVSRDSKTVGKIPMLMMRYDKLPKNFFFVAIKATHYHKFREGLMLDSMSSIKVAVHVNSKDYENIVILRSTEFFSLSYKAIKKIAKKIIADETKAKA